MRSDFKGAPPDHLTPRQREVVRLVAHGMGHREIAAALGISEHTVTVHITAIFGVMGVRTCREVAAWYWRKQCAGQYRRGLADGAAGRCDPALAAEQLVAAERGVLDCRGA